MKQMKKLLAVLLAVVMMASLVTVAISAEDPVATPLFTWEKGFSSPGTSCWGGFPSAADGTATVKDDYYTPVGSADFFYNGPISGWQALHYGFWGGKTFSTTDLSVYDGLCFFLNVSSEHKFDIPGIRLTASAKVPTKDDPTVEETASFTFVATPEVLERDKDLFIYLPWSAFANDDKKDVYGSVELEKEDLTNMANQQLQIYSGKWNESASYKPTLKFTISDIYGYKTNDSEDPDDFTFEIPHDPSVKNLPAYFADRMVDEEVLEAVKAAYDAAEAKLASGVTADTCTAEDIEVLQAFLDIYDTANTATQEALAEIGITKDANPVDENAESWYRISAVCGDWADNLAYRESNPGGNTPDVPTTQAPVTQAPTTVAPTPTTPVTPDVVVTEAKPAKVKGVKVKAGKKKVTVTWKKAKNAKKYAVKYSYKKNMKGAKVVSVKKAKAVIKKLKSGKKVYVQVQGVNGKTKGAFSKKVAKKVK